MSTHPHLPNIALRQGRLWIDGVHQFQKIGKPLRNYADATEVDELIDDLPVLREKNYTCLELNCYWHHFDHTGRGEITVSLDPLRRLITAIRDHGLYPSLSVETYGVGGGQLPKGFWELHPEAGAIDSDGSPVEDTEYGFMSRVPSLFSPDYLHASRAFIRALTAGVDHRQFLWFETTVEPQFMGSRWVDYGPDARRAYHAWLKDNDLSGPLIPESFPIPEAFLRDPTWNRFRAQWLAGWVNDDAQAFRDIAGPGAWIAIDYLDANEMTQRCGDPVEFLRHLSCPDIIQVNWTWDNVLRAPNHKAYQRVRQVMAETGRDWAITEHMTINGTDYHAHEMESLLENTLAHGTQFGWEFVDVARNLDCESIKPGTVQPGAFKPCHFSVYDSNWNPKPPMDVVDSKWDHWLEKIYKP